MSVSRVEQSVAQAQNYNLVQRERTPSDMQQERTQTGYDILGSKAEIEC